MDFNQDNNNQNRKPNKNSKPPGFSLVVLTTLLTAFMVLGIYNFSESATKKEITYGEFLEMVESGEVEEVVIGSDKISIKPKTEETQENIFGVLEITYYTGIMDDPGLVDRL